MHIYRALFLDLERKNQPYLDDAARMASFENRAYVPPKTVLMPRSGMWRSLNRGGRRWI